MLIFLLLLELTLIIPRVGWNLQEAARLVSAFRFVLSYYMCDFSVHKTFHLNKNYTICSHFGFRSTDGGQGLAMAGWQSDKDTVENKVYSCNLLFGVIVVDLLPDPCNRQLLHDRVWGRGGRQRHLRSNAAQGQTRRGQTSWMEGHRGLQPHLYKTLIDQLAESKLRSWRPVVLQREVQAS